MLFIYNIGFWSGHHPTVGREKDGRMCVSRREIVELAFSVGVSSLSVMDLLEYLDTKFSEDVGFASELTSKVKFLILTIKKWEAAHRTKQAFVNSNSEWLNGNFCLPSPMCQAATSYVVRLTWPGWLTDHFCNDIFAIPVPKNAGVPISNALPTVKVHFRPVSR